MEVFTRNKYLLTKLECQNRETMTCAMLLLFLAHFVCHCLQICLVMGLPSVITTDQGREFNNQLNNNLTKQFGIKHRLTTPYHPQANGLDERFNQTLVNAVAKLTQDHRDTWDEKIGEVVFAYNTAVHESTKHTPFEVMFGRMAKLPIDFNLSEDYSPEEKVLDFEARDDPPEAERKARRAVTEEAVKANIKAAQVQEYNAFTCVFNVSYQTGQAKGVLRPETQGSHLFLNRVSCPEEGF